MKTSWMVIANSAKADIYCIDIDRNDYTLIKTFENEDSKLKTSELSPDQAGQYGAGTGGHATYSHADPHHNVIEGFASNIAKYLDIEKGNDKFQNLFLVAEPSFLGMLYGFLSKKTQDLVKAKVDKNYIPTLDRNEISVDNIISLFHRQL